MPDVVSLCSDPPWFNQCFFFFLFFFFFFCFFFFFFFLFFFFFFFFVFFFMFLLPVAEKIATISLILDLSQCICLFSVMFP